MSGIPPPILCRPGVQADLSAIMGVMERAFDPIYGEAWTRSQVEGMLDMPGSWLTVAAAGERIIAFSLMRSILDEAELLLLAVDPAWQGKKVGRTLLLDNISAAKLRNIGHIHLEVRATNKAIDLYRSAGFVHSNTRRAYYRGRDGQLFDAHSFTMNLVDQNKKA